MAKSDGKSSDDQLKKTEAKATVAKHEAVVAKRALAKERAKNLGSVADTKLQGFMDFIRQQGIVGLAVGLAIGTQAGATVKAIVEGLITPIVAFIVGSNTALQNAKWHVVGRDTKEINYLFTLDNRELVFGWGQVLSSLITLLAVAAVIYFVVKGIGLDKLDKKKE